MQVTCNLDSSQLAPNVPLASFTLELTSKDIGRLVFALDRTIADLGDSWPDDPVIARLEDLSYRLQGLPDSCLQSYVEGRQHDHA